MPRRLIVTMAAVSMASIASVRSQAPSPPDGSRCEALTALHLPDVRVSGAQRADANASATGPVHVAHCHVTGTIGTEIGFGLWLPDGWNGRFLMTGGGGFVGALPGPGTGVDQGFAVTTTDTGHRSDGTDARWALDNLERQLNFGYLATHRTEETARAIVRQYYGSDPHHSYFNGCSTGGRQALMEAQRFPNDFDGIVSGAPVYNWTQALSAAIKNAQAVFPDPGRVDTPLVTMNNLLLVERAALEACDARDGVTDGIIDDPRSCAFDLRSVKRCDGAAAADCLTDAQRQAIARVQSPLKDANGLVYEGQPVGGEAYQGGWDPWVTGVNPRTLAASGVPNLSWGFGTQFFKYFVFADPDWTYRGYDIAANWQRDTRRVASFLDADNPDLSAFRARKGKLLLWHGWADPALNPLATIRYYDRVVARDPGAAADVRLFMLPGVLHCAGGPGPDQVDRLAAMVDWVEKGEAPSRLVAAKRNGATVVRTRPLCAYPSRAVYKGSGSTDDAANFVCR
jgi:Tannase and feruloyl esterase